MCPVQIQRLDCMEYSSVNNPQGFCDALEATSEQMSNEGKEYSVWSAGAIGAVNHKSETIVQKILKMEKALDTVMAYCKDRHDPAGCKPCDCLQCRTKRTVEAIIDNQLTPNP